MTPPAVEALLINVFDDTAEEGLKPVVSRSELDAAGSPSILPGRVRDGRLMKGTASPWARG
ncbi:hypothetical protein AB0B45_10175 [Nonomuraea sp. NPDC049152]|uniref:hypothetical protein n=1 Tax=Nonomuraea sp. NPDC049152 TaxID=3154350 RepID=UPI003407CF10